MKSKPIRPKPIRNKDFNVSLKYYLGAKENYVVGGPVIISFTLENQTDTDLWILIWHTPLEGLRGRNFLVMCDGEEISYEGRMVKRGDPVRDDYVHIRAGESLSAEVDLSLAYNLPVADECRVEFKGQIHDFVSGEDYIHRRRDEHQGVHIFGNIVCFQLVSHCL